jgi:hypothetical protein
MKFRERMPFSCALKGRSSSTAQGGASAASVTLGRQATWSQSPERALWSIPNRQRNPDSMNNELAPSRSHPLISELVSDFEFRISSFPI